MKKNILFEPQKIVTNQAPLILYEKEILLKKTNIVYTELNLKSLEKLSGGKTLNSLALLSEASIKVKKNQFNSNYVSLKLNSCKETYINKYLSQYLFESFRKAFPVLSKLKPYHKLKTSSTSYTNSACNFDDNITPEIAFKLKQKKKKLTIETFFKINDKTYSSKDIQRFQFLIYIENTYFILKKTDWLLLEEIDKTTTFSYAEFTDKILKKLKNYPLEISEAFQDETRNTTPETFIQVSELGGNMLLFIPKWNYDGTIVDDQKESFEIFEGDKKITYNRNQEIERETITFLQKSHPNFKGQTNFHLSFEEASEKNWFFNFYHEKLKENYSVVGMDMLGFFRYSPHPIQTKFQITKTIDNEVVATFKTLFGKEKTDPKSLQKTINEGKNFVLLKDNSLGILTDEWLVEYALILKYATINDDEVTFAKWIVIASETLGNHQKDLRMILPENWMENWKKWNQTNIPLYPIPQTVNAKLRNYQQKGYEWINLMAEINAGTLLADDMGLGKTLQAIASLVYWQEQNPKLKALVICPASLIYNWKNEFEKFAPNINLSIYHGAERDFSEFMISENIVLITSYSIVRNDIEEFTKMVWDAIILDESHHIKNYRAKQTQAVLSIIGKRRIILNGTPIMNNVSDLFPQLSFLLPQLFYSEKKFRDDFEKPIQNNLEKNQMEMLRKLTSPFILRRTKEIAAPDLPQKTESIMWCEMNEDQRSAYETIKKQIRKNILVEIGDKGLNKAKLGVLQGIAKLRQVCSSPRLLNEYEAYQNASSIKIDNLIESLTTNLKDDKVIVFSQFLVTMELLSSAFKKNKIKYLSFSGKTLPEKRIKLVSEFQDEKSEVQVFLLSLMAGNSGINLTRANYVFLVEPWWNKAVQQQAIDRVHRIGQNQHVFAYNMICKDTIEEKIIALQNKKQFISEEVIGNDENFVKNLSEADIAFLFE